MNSARLTALIGAALSLSAFAAGAQAAEPEPMIVGVVPLSGGADGRSRADATRILLDAMGGIPGLTVVSLSGLDQMFGAGTSDQLAACGADDDCARRLLARIQTDRLVLGSLDPERVLRLRLVDSATTAGPPRVRVSMRTGFSQPELQQGVTSAALELFPDRADRTFGTLQLDGAPAGAEIWIAGARAGVFSMQAPPRATLRVAAGSVEVRVLAPGYAPYEATTSVLVGQRVSLRVDMAKNRSVGPLILGGAGLAAAGAAAILGATVRARASDWRAACPIGAPCAADYTKARYDSDEGFVDRGRVATNALWVTAGAAVVGAALWYLLDPGHEVSP